MDMDINKFNNFNNVRRRTNFPSNILFKSTFLGSRASLILYHEKIEINNDLPNQEYVDLIDSSQLSYSGNV